MKVGFPRFLSKEDFVTASNDRVPGDHLHLDQLLEVFARGQSPLRTVDLASATGIPQPLLNRLLSKLHREGKIRRLARGVYSNGMKQASLGVLFGINRGEWVEVTGTELRLSFESEKPRWISNEELGYSHSATLIMRRGDAEKRSSLSWYDRTEGDEDGGSFLWNGFRFLINGVSARGVGLTVFPAQPCAAQPNAALPRPSEKIP